MSEKNFDPLEDWDKFEDFYSPEEKKEYFHKLSDFITACRVHGYGIPEWNLA